MLCRGYIIINLSIQNISLPIFNRVAWLVPKRCWNRPSVSEVSPGDTENIDRWNANTKHMNVYVYGSKDVLHHDNVMPWKHGMTLSWHYRGTWDVNITRVSDILRSQVSHSHDILHYIFRWPMATYLKTFIQPGPIM